jgi:flagellar motor switch protein FliM
MADGTRNDVLGQKAHAAQRAFEARGMSMAKALRRALSRTADVLWDLALVTQGVTVEMMDQDEVVGALGPRDLLVLLDGPEGVVGIASLDRQVVTGLVEVQTIQQVTQMPVDDDRVLTQTDAAMISPLLDGALARLADTLVDHPLHSQLCDFRFGAMIEDSRSAGLLLEASAYRVFRAEIDLALGRRRGVLTLFLPERKPKRDSATAERAIGPHEERLSRVPARLDACLARVTMPLSRAGALKAGDLISLPPDSLDKVEVTAGRGHLVARGRLGQLNGLRAVRLNWPSVGGAGVVNPNIGQGIDQGIDAAPQDDDDAGFGMAPQSAGLLPPAEPAIEPFGGEEDLPDLPPMDFATDAADFDFGSLEDTDSETQPMDALPDIDIGDGFSAAPLEFDFDEQ